MWRHFTNPRALCWAVEFDWQTVIGRINIDRRWSRWWIRWLRLWLDIFKFIRVDGGTWDGARDFLAVTQIVGSGVDGWRACDQRPTDRNFSSSLTWIFRGGFLSSVVVVAVSYIGTCTGLSTYWKSEWVSEQRPYYMIEYKWVSKWLKELMCDLNIRMYKAHLNESDDICPIDTFWTASQQCSVREREIVSPAELS